MPCKSDHMRPTRREKKLQLSAQLTIWACRKLGRAVPDYAEHDADDMYASDERSETGLCAIMLELQVTERDEHPAAMARPSYPSVMTWGWAVNLGGGVLPVDNHHPDGLGHRPPLPE
ncbi:MAG: hypothetical protein DRP64_14900, partial [Verrucomicrobia bacterium]